MTMTQPNALLLPLLRRLMVAATLGAGFGTLWLVLVLWLGMAFFEARAARDPRPREDLAVTPDGTPLIASRPFDNLSLTTYRDLSGQVRDVPDQRDLVQMRYVSGEGQIVGFFASGLGWEERLGVFADEREPAVNWFFVHDGQPAGAGYFVGYERKTQRRVGTIGRAGFRGDGTPPNERIAVRGAVLRGDSAWSSALLSISAPRGLALRPERGDLPPRFVHVPSGRALLRVDLHARSVAVLFEAPEPIVTVGTPTLSAYSYGRITTDRPILVRTRSTLYALGHDGKVRLTFTIPPEINRQGDVWWYDVSDGGAVVTIERRPSPEMVAQGLTDVLIYRLLPGGLVEEPVPVRLRGSPPAMTQRTELFLMATALPAPVILAALEPAVVMQEPRWRSYVSAVGVVLREWWPPLVATAGLSALLAWVTSRWSRHFGHAPRERAAWTALVLLFGLPAFVGFWLHRRWPVRMPCPACRELAPRDRTLCAECGAEFPEPSLQGVEIFA
jgi:hypothetical protein